MILRPAKLDDIKIIFDWANDKEIHIDLRFADVSDARKWGVQQLPIHIFLPE